MARWTLYYGGRAVVAGLNDAAKEQIKEQIAELADKPAWFTGYSPGGGGFDIYLHPGVHVAFESSDATVDDAPFSDDDPATIYGVRDG